MRRSRAALDALVGRNCDMTSWSPWSVSARRAECLVLPSVRWQASSRALIRNSRGALTRRCVYQCSAFCAEIHLGEAVLGGGVLQQAWSACRAGLRRSRGRAPPVNDLLSHGRHPDRHLRRRWSRASQSRPRPCRPRPWGRSQARGALIRDVSNSSGNPGLAVTCNGGIRCTDDSRMCLTTHRRPGRLYFHTSRGNRHPFDLCRCGLEEDAHIPHPHPQPHVPGLRLLESPGTRAFPLAVSAAWFSASASRSSFETSERSH